MGFKYKNSALKKMLTMSSKQQAKYSGYKLLIDKDAQEEGRIFTDNAEKIPNKKGPISFIAGITAGLFLTRLLIVFFPNILSFHQQISNYQNYDQDRLTNGADIDFGSHDNESKVIADQLYKEVRVLCWVMTEPANHEKKAQIVKNTWGQKCNKLIFMSSIEDGKLGAVALPVQDGEHHLWPKTKKALKYIYQHYLDEYDWFMKADDETYVILENLRKMLYAYSTEFPVYFGSQYKPEVQEVYMHSGPGYVLSREALKRFVEKGLINGNKCRHGRNGMEYFEFLKCMKNLEVIIGDSRDEFERGRMFPFLPSELLLPDRLDAWYWPLFFYKSNKGLDCCSDHAISFHCVKPNDMYELDYLIYHLRPFGITPATDILPNKILLNSNINEFFISKNNISK